MGVAEVASESNEGSFRLLGFDGQGRLAHRCLAGGCGCRSRRLPRSGGVSAGGVGARRSAASGEPWTWRSLSLQPKSERSRECCHRLACSAGPGVDQLSGLLVLVGASPARTQLVVQALNDQIEVALPPFTHRNT